MKQHQGKYQPFPQVGLKSRKWPENVISKAPAWCSVDLRDGNQALVNPMNLNEKLLMFKTLCDIGFKEIEVGFPSASETEYEILRALIDGNYIPDDVTVQVLVQARPHLIRKTFDAISGAKNVIVHFYNSTSALQRKVVFKMDMDGIINIARDAAKLIKTIAAEPQYAGMNLRLEYSPESFSGTEPDNAVAICAAVLDELGATAECPVILNLPNTVEMCTPNTYADQVEYFINNLPGRERAIISLHPHNDRGTGVACAELGILAGAERIEGTLFGNGERTGNVDIITLALNMYTQGVDPCLDFSDLNRIREIYEQTTGMKVHERHAYAGELVFTAFSGSHQDAINKGTAHMRESGSAVWEIPYLPIDPADVGREYDPVIRINSQSGKGGAAFILQNVFGLNLPKAMHPEFGGIVKKACDTAGRELKNDEIYELFRREFMDIKEPYALTRHKLHQEEGSNGEAEVTFEGTVTKGEREYKISGAGNGPIDAFFGALGTMGIKNYEFVSYNEHAISDGADSKAIAYIHLKSCGRDVFGVGVSSNINIASIRGVLCAINRDYNNGKAE